MTADVVLEDTAVMLLNTLAVVPFRCPRRWGYTYAAPEWRNRMLRLNHFFKGMLKREESASAFLAMALEGVPSFRRYFFAALPLPPELQDHLSTQQWTAVAVEKNSIDVYLTTSGHVVLIENKIQAGAKQSGQLLRYYRRERKQPHQLAVVAVYVAPGEMGSGEVKEVTRSDEFRKHQPNDHAVRLSWDALLSYELPHPDHDEELVVNGLAAIAEAIRDAAREVYVGEGERAKLRELFHEVERQALGRVRSVPLRLWHASNEYLETNHTTVSLHVKTRLDSVTRTSPTVEGVFENGHFQLPMVAAFKKAARVKRNSPVGRWWQSQVNGESIPLASIGTFTKQGKDWFSYDFEVEGNNVQAAEQIVDMMERLVHAIRDMLKDEGLSLLEEPHPSTGTGAGEGA